MEIYSKNGDCYKAKSGIDLAQQDSSSKKRYKAPLPPITEFPSSTLPSNKGLSKWNSTPVIHEDFCDLTFPLSRKVPDLAKLGQKTFLRSTEHILATFYGLVFIIEGPDWHCLKSENLPIYFVRVSVKNVKYPFRILVIDIQSEKFVRVIDFIVSCKTKTSIKEDAVCWQNQEKFGAKFSNKSLAFQFYDTISRMASTIRKAEELENQNLDKMVHLEIHLPNSEVRAYRFYQTDTLKGALKMVCTREKLRLEEHYFHHMQRTDDSVNMALRIGDLRTDKIRLISTRAKKEGSTNTIDKVSISSSRKKNRGFFSFFRRRFSRKRKESPQYSSAPSVIQYTDNVFMVERQAGDQAADEIDARGSNSSSNLGTRTLTHQPVRATKSDATTTSTTSKTLPTRNVKRKAPQPPNLTIPKSGQPTPVANGHHTTGVTKTTKKRRAPSPPPNPPSITNYSPTADNQKSSNTEHKSPYPIFIAPPPPDSAPPPIDECETPVGPIDSELDDGSVEIPVDFGDIRYDTNSLDSKSTENCESESKASEETSNEVKVEPGVQDSTKAESVEDQDEKAAEVQTQVDNDTVDDESPLKKDETSNLKDENEATKADENENSLNQENIKNLTPEELQALLVKSQNPQDPVNLQNQQLFAMQQSQQMLSSILLQQMIQQQMTQRQPTVIPMAGMMPVSSLHPMQLGSGGVNTMQPGVMSPVGTIPGMQPPMNGANYTDPMWPHGQPPAQSIPPPVPPSVPKATDEVETSTSSTSSDDLPKEVKSESGSQTETPKPSLPMKEEELVNRPLFKKMLAQVSQGKLDGIPPKIASQRSQESETTLTSPISPTAKIAKVPTSYVASAEKIVPQSKPEEERKAPITLGEIGRKSSYVDSAISKKKIDSVIQTDTNVTKPSKNDAVNISEIPTKVFNVDSTIHKPSDVSKPNEKIEMAFPQAAVATDSGNVSLNASLSTENPIKHENPSSNTMLTKMVPSAPNIPEQNKPLVGINEAHTVDTPKLTSQTSTPSAAAMVPVSTVASSNVTNYSPSINASKSYTPNSGSSQANPPISHSSGISGVVNHNPSPHPKPLIIAPKPYVSASGGAVVNHITSNKPLVAPKTPTNPPDITSIARHAAQVAAEKRNSQISKPPTSVGHTPHKLKIEEPVLGTFKYQRTVIPPLSPPAVTDSTELNQNGGQLSYSYATTGRIKTDRPKPPQVAQKPRHLSEPKPTVAMKPTYEMRQSKTLPKSRKPQHIQISLSLSPEERSQLHSKQTGLTANSAGR